MPVCLRDDTVTGSDCKCCWRKVEKTARALVRQVAWLAWLLVCCPRGRRAVRTQAAGDAARGFGSPREASVSERRATFGGARRLVVAKAPGWFASAAWFGRPHSLRVRHTRFQFACSAFGERSTGGELVSRKEGSNGTREPCAALEREVWVRAHVWKRSTRRLRVSSFAAVRSFAASTACAEFVECASLEEVCISVQHCAVLGTALPPGRQSEGTCVSGQRAHCHSARV